MFDFKELLKKRTTETGPLLVAGSYAHVGKADVGCRTIVLIGVGINRETGERIRVRMEMTPEDAKACGQSMFSLAKRQIEIRSDD